MKRLFLFLTLFCTSAYAHFSWDILRATSKSGENQILSPYSVQTCLAMAAKGARGETYASMNRVLDLLSFQPHFSDHFQMTNRLWIDQEFFILPTFHQTVVTEFQGNIESLDFQNPTIAAETINDWISYHTDKKIPHLIDSTDLDRDTKLVLTNTLCFSGQFVTPFNPKSTQLHPFWLSKNSTQETLMMETTASYQYFEDDDVQVVALPFDSSPVHLVISLPKGDKRSLPSTADLSSQKIHLRLPKFTLRHRLDLKESLEQLGLELPFSPEADFSGINGKHDLYLSKVIHEAYFDLDENGVVAAAATAATINCTSTVLLDPPIEFIADHAFVFALIDFSTSDILFLGEYNHP